MTIFILAINNYFYIVFIKYMQDKWYCTNTICIRSVVVIQMKCNGEQFDELFTRTKSFLWCWLKPELSVKRRFPFYLCEFPIINHKIVCLWIAIFDVQYCHIVKQSIIYCYSLKILSYVPNISQLKTNGKNVHNPRDKHNWSIHLKISEWRPLLLY